MGKRSTWTSKDDDQLRAGSLWMVAWEHPLSIIWEDPLAIFWDSHTRIHNPVGRLWWAGPLFIAAGAFWIAEDWFGFGQRKP